MKCYFFVPTGEARQVKDGEYYLCNDKSMIHWEHPSFNTWGYPVFIRHEIEVPVGATELGYWFLFPSQLSTTKRIPLHTKKPRVKKWKWVIGSRSSLNYPEGIVYITKHYTDEGVKHACPNEDWYHKIPETEIEEEE